MHTQSELAGILALEQYDADPQEITLHGTVYVVYHNQVSVGIHPKDEALQKDYAFSACVNNERFFECNISAKDNLGRRLPGFFAKEFFVLAFHYLQQRNTILGIKGVWRRKTHMSDNFRMFSKNKQEHLPDDQSSFNTWTGKIARELGYTQVRISADDPSYIHAYFT